MGANHGRGLPPPGNFTGRLAMYPAPLKKQVLAPPFFVICGGLPGLLLLLALPLLFP